MIGRFRDPVLTTYHGAKDSFVRFAFWHLDRFFNVSLDAIRGEGNCKAGSKFVGRIAEYATELISTYPHDAVGGWATWVVPFQYLPMV